MANLEAQLEQQLKEAGERLLYPSDSIRSLLALLDQLEKLLSKVDPSPTKSMLESLEPSMKALVQESLLGHFDIDVKVSVAYCICEIARITAPNQPYDDDQMRDIFKLIAYSLEDIADQSSRWYIKRASILETVSKVKFCIIMLDLECDALIVDMFKHFLRSVRDHHCKSVYTSMESIMVMLLHESDDISAELLKPLLVCVKKDNKGVPPIARKLAEGVLQKSAAKLEAYLLPAIKALGDTLDNYTKVVASVCKRKKVRDELDDAPEEESEGDEWLPDDTAMKKMGKPKQKGTREKLKRRTSKRLAAAKINIPPEEKSEGDDRFLDNIPLKNWGKLKKRTGRKKFAPEKVISIPPKEESEDDEWLPADWSMQLVKCYIGPKGNKCYSKQQVLEYLEKMNTKLSNENTVIAGRQVAGLPDGWKKELRVREDGNGKFAVFIDPLGEYAFYSIVDAEFYITYGDVKLCRRKPQRIKPRTRDKDQKWMDGSTAGGPSSGGLTEEKQAGVGDPSSLTKGIDDFGDHHVLEGIKDLGKLSELDGIDDVGDLGVLEGFEDLEKLLELDGIDDFGDLGVLEGIEDLEKQPVWDDEEVKYLQSIVHGFDKGLD